MGILQKIKGFFESLPWLFKLPGLSALIEIVQQVLETRDITDAQIAELDKIAYGFLPKHIKLEKKGTVAPGEIGAAIQALEDMLKVAAEAIDKGKALLTAFRALLV